MTTTFVPEDAPQQDSGASSPFEPSLFAGEPCSSDQPAVMPCASGVSAGCGFCLDNLDDTKGHATLSSSGDPSTTLPDPSGPQRIHVEMTSRRWHGIKQSLELIRNSYRTCIITADDKFFQIMAYDTKGQSLGFLLKIPTSNVEPYVCLSPISISVSTMRITDIIRQVRKSETVMFYIDSRNQTCGVLSNSTAGHARKREMSVSVVQLTYFEEPPMMLDTKPFVVATSDFGRMLKVCDPVDFLRVGG